jgi:Transposase DDE domain
LAVAAVIRRPIAVGVKTHIALSAWITDEHGADYSEFVPLLTQVRRGGHTHSVAVGDKAYLGRGNFEGATDLDMEGYIPFKSNWRGVSHGSPIWNRKYHELMSRRDEFDAVYNRRSNSESTNSGLKRVLGEELLSRTQVSRMSKLLAKILAWNVAVVIKQSHFHGFEPSAPAPIPPGNPQGGTPSAAVAADRVRRRRRSTTTLALAVGEAVA